MIKADTPSLWEIRAHADHATAVAVLVTALIHLSRLVNLPQESNLNRAQIGEIANDVIEEYGYMKPEEVKYLLKQSVRENKLFGRLDYSVVMKWFSDYADERVGHCVDISNQEATQEANNPDPSPGGISFSNYMSRLWDMAYYADPDAVERLCDYQSPKPSRMTLITDDKNREKEIEFKKFYYDYLRSKR